jgi:4-alpha-glucanotransferase
VGAFDAYCRAHRNWLDHWSLYAALRDKFDGTPWHTWPTELRLRKPAALREARRSLADEIRFQQFLQYTFDRQWTALRGYAREHGVGLVGDIPIFVSHDSADVWAHPQLFLLDEHGFPKAISGYPPDAFNKLGQTWGHSQYDWAAHKREKFAWWVLRFKETLRLFDGARIDHFLGFHRTWHIPFGATDARRGKWVASPGFELFRALLRKLPDAQIIAEDLGKLTPQAAKLRDAFNFPGMRVMQFGFGPGGDYHLPHRYPTRSVIYPGTHDNNTINGWMDELRSTMSIAQHKSRAAEYEKMLKYLHSDGRAVHLDMIRAAMGSVADTVIFQAQDVLGLDVKSRMNVPGTVDNNWRWRLRDGQLTSTHAAKLREMCELYDRVPPLRSASKPSGSFSRREKVRMRASAGVGAG